MNAFIFHGTDGYPEENWFPWLKRELEAREVETFVPQFPTPNNQTPNTWLEVFDSYSESYGTESILIGHSLGGAFALRLLERRAVTPRAVFIISSPIGIKPIKNWQTDQPFIEDAFNWELITSRCKNFTVFHSDDDPYVCLANGKTAAEKLGVKLNFIPNSGHFNDAAGFTEFTLLLDEIKTVL